MLRERAADALNRAQFIAGRYARADRRSGIVEDLLEVAAPRLRYWRSAAVDPTIDRELTPIVEFVCIAYELLWHHVREAQRHLAFEEGRIPI
jgi:hypothetical protein